MRIEKQNKIEAALLVGLFVVTAVLTFKNVDQSISIIKYHLQMSIFLISEKYLLFHNSFKDFIYISSFFHHGNSVSGWYSSFFLLPLFLFCDLFGGLSLQMICYFTITTTLISLVLFYFWIKSFLGKEIACYASILFGFSAIFQEIARSGSFVSYTFLFVMIWLCFFFNNYKSEKLRSYLILGILTGFLWHCFGVIRGLTLVALLVAWSSRKPTKDVALAVLFLGLGIVLIPGIILLFIQKFNTHQTLAHARDLLFHDYGIMFFNSHQSAHVERNILSNLTVFFKTLTGNYLNLEPGLIDGRHARLYNSILLIPLFLGIVKTIRSWKERTNQLLLLISAAIYILPIFTSSYGYVEARRSLFYVIPSYCFIGIGLKMILDWIKTVQNQLINKAVLLILWGTFLFIFVSEQGFINNIILSSKRDLGLLAFTDQIKKGGFKGNLIYVEDKTVYKYNRESRTFSTIIYENGKSPLNTIGSKTNLQVPAGLIRFYVAQSSLTRDEDFNNWCLRNRLKTELLIEAPVVNSDNRAFRKKSFKFYRAYRITYNRPLYKF